MAYLSLSDFKTYKGIVGTADDALIAQLIARAQGYIENVTDRVFEAAADTTRYFDAWRDVNIHDETFHGRRLLRLDRDLCQITSIVNGDGTTVSSSEYVTEPRNTTPWYAIRLKINSSIVWVWTTSPENAISVTGRWAYSLTPPADVVQATAELTSYFYARRGAELQQFDQPQVSPSGVTIFPAGLPQVVKDVASKYQKTGFP